MLVQRQAAMILLARQDTTNVGMRQSHSLDWSSGFSDAGKLTGHALQALPSSDNPQLQHLLNTTVASKSHGLDAAKDWRLVSTGVQS